MAKANTNLFELFNLFVKQVEDYAIYLLDAEGRVLTWNPGAERIKGYSADEIVGEHLSRFYPPEDRDMASVALRDAAKTGHFETESWRLRKDGSRFWGSISLTALRDDSGELKGYAKITRDLTERMRAEQKLRATELKYELLMAGVNEYAVFLLDAQGRIIDWSSAAQRLLGYSERDVIGRHLEILFPPDQHGPGGVPAHVLKEAAEKGRTEEESWHARQDGSLFWGSGITSVLRDDAGGIKGFAKVLLDRTARKQADEALREANRRKDEFLAMLGHELRNPLAPIKSGLDLLRLEGANQEIVQIMSEQVGHVVRLVDDLLDMSRIVQARVELKQQPVQLADVIRRAVESVTPMFEDQRQEFSNSLPADPFWINVDPVRMAQVFSNLLTNAGKYTEPGGRISVNAERDDAGVVVRVKDTGIGIDPDLLPHVFDLFTQSDRTIERAQGGLGIGLTVVKRLVEMHGGRVSVMSGGAGQGSEFTVWLPTVDEPEPTLDDASVVEERLPETVRILVVDDNVAAATLLVRLLSKLGRYKTETAHDGEAAIAAAKSRQPDLILLDIGLPKLDGYEVARQLRALPEFKATFLVALTGYGSEGDQRRSADAGFDEHVVKPPSLETLQHVLRMLARRMK